MHQNDTDPLAPGLPSESGRPLAAPSAEPDGDTLMPAAARIVIEEPTGQDLGPWAPSTTPSLAQLAHRWEALNRDAQEAWSRLEAASSAAERIVPPFPPNCVDHRGFLMDRPDLVRMDEAERREPRPSSAGSPRVAAYDLWNEQHDAIASSFGIPGLEEAADRAQVAANRLAEAIMTMRPASAAEAAIKFRIVRIRFENGQGGFDQPDKIHNFQADLDHLAEIAGAR